jgi:hypothetical protein
MKKCLAVVLALLLMPAGLLAAPGEWVAHGVGYSLCVGTNGSTNSSAAGSGADIPFTLACTTKPRDHKAGTVIDACALITVATASGAPQAIVKLKAGSLGTITLVSNAPFLPANSSTTNGWVCFKSVIKDLPGAAVPTYSSFVTYPSATADARDSNATAALQSLATNGDLVWTVTWQWVGPGSGGASTAKLEVFVLQLSN